MFALVNIINPSTRIRGHAEYVCLSVYAARQDARRLLGPNWTRFVAIEPVAIGTRVGAFVTARYDDAGMAR